jgi:hypothetical protein
VDLIREKKILRRVPKKMLILSLLILGIVLSIFFVLTIYLFTRPTVDLEFYEHLPSEKFYHSSNTTFPSEFVKDDIIFTIALKGSSDTSYICWLGPYSQTIKKDLILKRVEFIGEKEKKVYLFNKTLEITDYDEEKGLYTADFKIDDIKADELKKIVGQGDHFKILINVHTNNGKKIHNLEFFIKKKVETHRIFST